MISILLHYYSRSNILYTYLNVLTVYSLWYIWYIYILNSSFWFSYLKKKSKLLTLYIISSLIKHDFRRYFIFHLGRDSFHALSLSNTDCQYSQLLYWLQKILRKSKSSVIDCHTRQRMFLHMLKTKK